MTSGSCTSFSMWLKRNPVVFLFIIIFFCLFVSLFFVNIDTDTISKGEVLAILVSTLSGFVTLYFGLEFLAFQQEMREYMDSKETVNK